MNSGRSNLNDFNKKKIEKLKNLLTSLENLIGACSFTQTGKYFPYLAFSVSDMSLSSFWVIDLGATDHVTHSLQKFSTCSPCPSNKKIAIADGSLTTVADQGEIPLNKNVVLKNVLHVPKLSTNLVSIHRLTNVLNCHVIFYPSYCIFKNKVQGRRLDMLGKRMDFTISSYRLVKVELRINYPHPFSLKSHPPKKIRFGFFTVVLDIRYLMFLRLCPSLFKGIDVEKLHYNVCELTKHYRASFLISNKRGSIPFALIHSNIWGPSTIPNMSSSRWFVSFINDCTCVTWHFLLKEKSDISIVFPNFHKMIKT